MTFALNMKGMHGLALAIDLVISALHVCLHDLHELKLFTSAAGTCVCVHGHTVFCMNMFMGEPNTAPILHLQKQVSTTVYQHAL